MIVITLACLHTVLFQTLNLAGFLASSDIQYRSSVQKNVCIHVHVIVCTVPVSTDPEAHP